MSEARSRSKWNKNVDHLLDLAGNHRPVRGIQPGLALGEPDLVAAMSIGNSVEVR
jgi:hypothetical protein